MVHIHTDFEESERERKFQMDRYNRCTNVSLATIGIFPKKRIEKTGHFLRVLERNYNSNCFLKPQKDCNFLFPSCQKECDIPLGNYYPGRDEKEKIIFSAHHYFNDLDLMMYSFSGIAPTSVNSVAKHIKKVGLEGHYLLFVSGHVLTIHQVNASTIMVDTELKFRSKRRAWCLVRIPKGKATEHFDEWITNSRYARAARLI